MEPVLGNPLSQIHDFELQDFITDDAQFDQFVNLIRGEDEDPTVNFDFDFVNGSNLIDEHAQFGPNPGYVLDFNSEIPDSVFNTMASFDGEMKVGDGEDKNDGEDSSATTTTTEPATKRAKVDRSRTLVSERRRRGRMKEKLYALRSLVPNITKMDKASIVGDAASYVQQLQNQAKKLKAEIAGLEASINGPERYQGSTKNPNKIHQLARPNQLLPKNIIQMDIFQVEERGFYMRLVCNKGEGIAMSLYKVLESLTSFNVQSSNLATASDKFVLTATLNEKNCEQEMNYPNLKLWVTGALLNHGFDFISTFAVAA